MYVSRAVESIRSDPIEGDTVELVLETTEDTDSSAVAAAVEAVGGTIERSLQFDDLAISIPQARVDDICALDGLAAVQTTDAISITHEEATDEDVEFDE